MRSPDGIASTVLIPSELNSKINSVPVRVALDTEYPFRGTLCYTVETPSPVSFTLSVRIPRWAKSAEVDGTAAEVGFYHIKREWKGKTEIKVTLHFETRLVKRPDGMFCLERGPLVYSVAPKDRWVKHEFTRNGVERTFPYCDWELFAESPWNFAFTKDAEKAEVIEAPVSATPFSPDAPPVSLKAMMVPIEWKFADGVCESHPEAKVLGKPVPITLIPYGSTNLRITEMPLVGI
jgi:hypothetical protein